MNAQNNGPSLTGVVDIIANSISLFQDNGAVKNINDIFTNENDISTAEPYDVAIDELGIRFRCTNLLGILMIQKWLG